MNPPLYEFTYTADELMPIDEVEQRVKTFLIDEAVTRNWLLGYTFKIVTKRWKFPATMEYHFVVHGDYCD